MQVRRLLKRICHLTQRQDIICVTIERPIKFNNQLVSNNNY